MGDEVTCEDLGDAFPSVEDFNKGPSTYNVCSEEDEVGDSVNVA